MVIPTITAAFVDQSVFQRLISAKDYKTSLWGNVFGGLLMIPIAFVPVLIGMYGSVVFPNVPASSVFWTVTREHMPPVITGLMIAAVLAAVMSTCDIIFLIISATVVHDIYKGMIKPSATDKECKRLAIILNIAAGLFGVLIALRLTNVITILSISYTIKSAGCLIPFIAGLLWKRGNQSGALAGSIVGVAVALLSYFRIVRLPFDILSILAALAAYVVVSLLTEARQNAKLKLQ